VPGVLQPERTQQPEPEQGERDDGDEAAERDRRRVDRQLVLGEPALKVADELSPRAGSSLVAATTYLTIDVSAYFETPGYAVATAGCRSGRTGRS
jgi:hypothetical protein